MRAAAGAAGARAVILPTHSASTHAPSMLFARRTLVPHRSLLHADHAAWPARSDRPEYLQRATPAADASLARVLARCGAMGDFAASEALAATAAFARRAALHGANPAQVASSVRRSLTAAAPAHMTVVSYETIARCLVRHAMHALLDD
jgi:hypothetical protein